MIRKRKRQTKPVRGKVNVPAVIEPEYEFPPGFDKEAFLDALVKAIWPRIEFLVEELVEGKLDDFYLGRYR